MQYEKIIYGVDDSFIYRDMSYKYFPMPLHHHAEIEIVLITEGHGKRFVNDSMESFGPGDLVVIGSNIPHFHLSDKSYYQDNDLKCGSCVIQFAPNILPDNMGDMHEFANIKSLIDRSIHGVRFSGLHSMESVHEIMRTMDRLSGIKRYYTLLRILNILGQQKNYTLISKFDYQGLVSEFEINDTALRIYNYLIANFKNNVTLDGVASHVNQNPTSLCRYFKKNTQKSIFDCLNEIRIGYACKLLLNSDFAISQIAYESGFQTLSNFNKQFKKVSGMSPTHYRTNL